MRTWCAALTVLALAWLLTGCQQMGPSPDAKTLVIRAQGPQGSKLSGSLRATTLGGVTKNFEILVPGEAEFHAGPAEYTLQFDGCPRDVTYTVSLDGQELQRGRDMVVEDDKGPRITFTVKKK